MSSGSGLRKEVGYREEGKSRSSQLKGLGVQLVSTNHPGWFDGPMLSAK